MSMIDYTAIGLRAADPAGAVPASKQTLGQEDFLTLLVTQLQNQDPLNPLDNEAFVAQLAQFSTVSGINEVSSSLGRLEQLTSGGQRNSAPAWIGRTVASADGVVGEVLSVAFADDGSTQLYLDNGSTLPLSDVSVLA